MATERAKQFLRYGSSPRGVQALILGAKVHALIDGRRTAENGDVAAVAKQVLCHRLMPNFEAESEGVTADDLVDEALEAAATAKVG
jgi:MoxR-like ATPase